MRSVTGGRKAASQRPSRGQGLRQEGAGARALAAPAWLGSEALAGLTRGAGR